MINQPENLRPKTGVGIMIFKDGKILLGKRKGSHGAGEYAFPGGHLEYMESVTDCALREIAEECGAQVENLKFQFFANFKNYAPKHYVHVNLVADWKSGEPQILEPEKCEGWGWYDIDNLPEPLFIIVPWAVESYKTGKDFFDFE
ncbi:MAG: NUDIX domain-containing protein [Candidatus Buchananbacteria bacterium]|nr:NUDIX domain-containing protein [Candidatus Buchananbacteria bacterium]